MSWKTNKIVLGIRDLGRKSGANVYISGLLGRSDYEHQFKRAMLQAIRPGDVVWDVGANRGFYSREFSTLVGSEGKVIAYEPSPDNVEHLKASVEMLDNVSILSAALGDHEDILSFEQGGDALGATGRVVETIGQTRSHFKVPVFSGDYLIRSGKCSKPNIIKIDTEGYELSVLRGLRQSLVDEAVRTVCVEIHFGSLKERKLPDAPRQIEVLLAKAGFTVNWTDPSHIVATRNS